jgi:uncharacterized protein (DUF1684 family)
MTVTDTQTPAAPTAARTAAAETDVTAGWTRWHALREAELRAEHGWLSITGFHWLVDAPTTLPGLPGRWQSRGGWAQLTATDTDGLVTAAGPAAGSPVQGSVAARVDEAGSTTWLRHGDRVVELLRRGGRDAVRVRDPKAPERLAFQGVPTFPVDPAWVRPARFSPFAEPAAITVETARPDLRQQVTAVGTVEVIIDGNPHVLTATAGPRGRLNLAFTDPTNGRLTAPWRVVSTDPAGDDGSLVIDFNRTVNLPFAFSEFGTCPAPVPGNHLPVAVNAGERAPRRVTGPHATLAW